MSVAVITPFRSTEPTRVRNQQWMEGW